MKDNSFNKTTEELIKQIKKIKDFMILNSDSNKSFEQLIEILEKLLVQLDSWNKNQNSEQCLSKIQSVIEIICKVVLILSMLNN